MAKLGELFVQIGVDLDAFNKDLKKVAKGFGDFGGTLKKTGKELSQSVSLPLAGFGIAALAASKKASEAFTGFADKTKSALGRFGDILFESLHMEGFLDGLSDAIEGAIGIFEDLPKWVQTAVTAFGALVVAIGPAIFIIGQLASVVKGAAETMRLLNSATLLLAKNPLVLLAVALGVAVAALGTYALSARGAADANRGYLDSIERAKNKTAAYEEALRKLHGEKTKLEEAIESATASYETWSSRLGPGNEVTARAAAMISFYAKAIDEAKKALEALNFEQARTDLQTAASAEAWEIYRKKIELADKQFALTGDNQERVNSLLAAAREHHEKILPLYDAEDDALKASAVSVAALEQQKLQLAEADRQAQASSVAAADKEKQRLESMRQEIQITKEAIISVGQTTGAYIAEVVAQTIVYGQTLSSVLSNVISSVASRLISMLIETFTVWISTKIAEIVTANIAAHSVVPFVGVALGVAAAVAAIAAARGLSRKEGGRAFADGGVVLSPVVGLVGEAGPEVVLPLDRLGEFLGGSGGGSQLVQIYLDGRMIAERAVRGMPAVLRFNGVTV